MMCKDTSGEFFIVNLKDGLVRNGDMSEPCTPHPDAVLNLN